MVIQRINRWQCSRYKINKSIKIMTKVIVYMSIYIYIHDGNCNINDKLLYNKDNIIIWIKIIVVIIIIIIMYFM
jgi:hypothetical protein